MKPLVNYCRWQRAKLRLNGRDKDSVWGWLVFLAADSAEVTRPFRFSLQTRELVLDPGEDEERIQLDEMGIEIT